MDLTNVQFYCLTSEPTSMPLQFATLYVTLTITEKFRIGGNAFNNLTQVMPKNLLPTLSCKETVYRDPLLKNFGLQSSLPCPPASTVIQLFGETYHQHTI